MSTRAAFGAVLREQLAESGLLQRELAERAGIGLRTLQTYLGGTADVPLTAVVALAHVLGTTLTDLAAAVDVELASADPSQVAV